MGKRYKPDKNERDVTENSGKSDTNITQVLRVIKKDSSHMKGSVI